jgi:hypothetical protein
VAIVVLHDVVDEIDDATLDTYPAISCPNQVHPASRSRQFSRKRLRGLCCGPNEQLRAMRERADERYTYQVA